MPENKLPAFSPPDKCNRPAEKLDDSELNQQVLKNLSGFKVDPKITDTFTKISEPRMINWLKDLTSGEFKTRHTSSPLNIKAAEWLKKEFQSIGYKDIEFQNFDFQGLTRHNVVVKKAGKVNNDSHIIVCAHYDSRMSNLNDSNSAAPGADDNASGVITLLELSHTLFELQSDCSILFICFSGEEQGLLGSSAFARHAHATGMDIRLVVNLDMVGHPADNANPTIIVEMDTGNVPANNEPSRQFAQQMAVTASSLTTISTRFGRIYDSDYMPFEHLGYVCVGLYDGADGETFYHTANDTPEQVDTGFCIEIVKMLTAFVIESAKKN